MWIPACAGMTGSSLVTLVTSLFPMMRYTLTIRTKDEMMMDWVLPIIDVGKCISCGLCAEQCPGHAVEMVSAGPVFARPEACTYCGACENLCPAGAISLEYEILIPAAENGESGL